MQPAPVDNSADTYKLHRYQGNHPMSRHNGSSYHVDHIIALHTPQFSSRVTKEAQMERSRVDGAARPSSSDTGCSVL